jgi:hypothetical protein
MVFANQLVLITGEAFFYAEDGQPSQVELFLFHGVRKTKYVFNGTFTKEFFPKLKNYDIKLKKERTSEQCPEFGKKIKKAYTTRQNCFNDIIILIVCNCQMKSITNYVYIILSIVWLPTL